MRKIPTLFRRSEDRRHVIPEVNPGCEWVLKGEGVATRKYDGTCVMFDGEDWWSRREVKPGKNTPNGWLLVDVDAATGKAMGWEPIARASHYKSFTEALARHGYGAPEPGTYELIGPKVNGNPEHMNVHMLVQHEYAARIDLGISYPIDAAAMFDRMAVALPQATFHGHPMEGVVWHHPDGRMVKLKGRDFPKPQHHSPDQS